jgi:hypothetical protein
MQNSKSSFQTLTLPFLAYSNEVAGHPTTNIFEILSVGIKVASSSNPTFIS